MLTCGFELLSRALVGFQQGTHLGKKNMSCCHMDSSAVFHDVTCHADDYHLPSVVTGRSVPLEMRRIMLEQVIIAVPGKHDILNGVCC